MFWSWQCWQRGVQVCAHTNYSGDVALNNAILRNRSLVCLLCKQLTHIGLTCCNLGIPIARFCWPIKCKAW
jgi:hypothetical protein